ncbi:MAG: hypothetical protein WCB11_10940 [Terriglobales bacterium]
MFKPTIDNKTVRSAVAQLSIIAIWNNLRTAKLVKRRCAYVETLVMPNGIAASASAPI